MQLKNITILLLFGLVACDQNNENSINTPYLPTHTITNDWPEVTDNDRNIDPYRIDTENQYFMLGGPTTKITPVSVCVVGNAETFNMDANDWYLESNQNYGLSTRFNPLQYMNHNLYDVIARIGWESRQWQNSKVAAYSNEFTVKGPKWLLRPDKNSGLFRYSGDDTFCKMPEVSSDFVRSVQIGSRINIYAQAFYGLTGTTPIFVDWRSNHPINTNGLDKVRVEVFRSPFLASPEENLINKDVFKQQQLILTEVKECSKDTVQECLDFITTIETRVRESLVADTQAFVANHPDIMFGLDVLEFSTFDYQDAGIYGVKSHEITSTTPCHLSIYNTYSNLLSDKLSDPGIMVDDIERGLHQFLDIIKPNSNLDCESLLNNNSLDDLLNYDRHLIYKKFKQQ